MKALRSLLQEQREEQAALEVLSQRRLLALQQATLKDLEQRLMEARNRHKEDAFTVQLLLSLKAQMQWLVGDLVERLEKELAGLSISAQKAGMQDLVAQVELMEGGISLAVQNRLALQLQERARLRTAATLRRYGVDLVERLERELAVSVLSKAGRYEAVTRLLSTSTRSFALSQWRAALVYRNELGSAYDDAAKSTGEELAGELAQVSSEPLLTRMDEARDRRSHPFSLVAHGTVAVAGTPWRVSVSEVAAMAARRGSRAGGIVWPIVDGWYQGLGYIAHHNDRGRRTCWRKSWGDPKAF